MDIETKVVATFGKLNPAVYIKANTLLADGVYPGLQDYLCVQKLV